MPNSKFLYIDPLKQGLKLEEEVDSIHIAI